MADMKRPKQQQHHAGREIGQRALQGEANRERRCAQHGDEACGLDAEQLEHGDADNRQHAVARDARHEKRHERVDAMGYGEHARDEALHRA